MEFDLRLTVETASENQDIETMSGTMDSDEKTQLLGMGLRTTVSPAQLGIYIILVLMGILGNAIVIVIIGKSIIVERGGGQNSNIIIVNMAVSNLMVSVMRNILLIISDIGAQVCYLFK